MANTYMREYGWFYWRSRSMPSEPHTANRLHVSSVTGSKCQRKRERGLKGKGASLKGETPIRGCER